MSQGQAREKEPSESGEAVLAENHRDTGRREPGLLQSPRDPVCGGGPRLSPVTCASVTPFGRGKFRLHVEVRLLNH